MSLGDVINSIKKSKGLTNQELADRAGLTLSTIDKITSGNNENPKLNTLKAICKVLDVTLDDLDDVDEKEKAPVSRENPEITEARAVRLYQALLSSGWIKEGEDITEEQLEVLDGISKILSALFNKSQ